MSCDSPERMVTEKTSYALLVRTVAFLLLCAASPAVEPQEAEPGTPWPNLRLSAATVTVDAVRMNGVALELLPALLDGIVFGQCGHHNRQGDDAKECCGTKHVVAFVRVVAGGSVIAQGVCQIGDA